MDSYNKLAHVTSRIAELETLRTLNKNNFFIYALETEELEKLCCQRDDLLQEINTVPLMEN